MNRAIIIFEIAGYISLICFSVFCIVLALNKRDITPVFIKRYYLFMVAFLFMDCIINAIVKQKLSNYELTQIIKAVIVAVIWTYYLNASSRVKQTFVVPYPN